VFLHAKIRAKFRSQAAWNCEEEKTFVADRAWEKKRSIFRDPFP